MHRRIMNFANEDARYLKAAKSLALLAVVTALFDWKTVLTDQFTLLAGAEGVNYTYSWLHFWIRSLRNAHVPLWDPYAFCGRPFAAEMLPSAFYPLHLVLLLIPFNRNGLFSPRLYNEIFAFSHADLFGPQGAREARWQLRQTAAKAC